MKARQDAVAGMIYIAYCSAAMELMSSADLAGLLKTSRVNNERAGITGMLLYREGSFIQVMEGPEAAVLALYETILHDRRHRNLIKLAQAPIAARSFDQWAMGFRDTRDLSPADFAAWSPYLDAPVDDHTFGGGKALKLLSAFREIARG